jgi:BirA family transcriptional regulator, biotin operon repressor / biotin---[acetyl-CoA-carboxylase] ligase
MSDPPFTDVRRFDSIDSTNRYLLDEARNGAPEGVVAVAGHQSAGRGRLGRRWEAPSGSNLLVSVLLRPDLTPVQQHLAAGVVALAAIDAVTASVGLDLGIKWPNDLLAADGRKLAGVLAEADLAVPPGSGHPPIVVGSGINANWPAHDEDLPEELVGLATSLRQQSGRPVDIDELLEVLLTALAPRAADLGTPAGRARQASDLQGRCATLGTKVRIELAGDRFEGTASGLTPEGHLVVDVGGATRIVVAGDVVHVRPGS